MATYWHGWHENDPPSSPEELTRRSLQSAWEEELLAEQDVDEAEVAISAEQYDTPPDDFAMRVTEIWEQAHGGRL